MYFETTRISSLDTIDVCPTRIFHIFELFRGLAKEHFEDRENREDRKNIFDYFCLFDVNKHSYIVFEYSKAFL